MHLGLLQKVSLLQDAEARKNIKNNPERAISTLYPMEV